MPYYNISSAPRKSSDITIPSTLDWREFWRAKSHRDGTDLQTLLRQHGRVLHEFWQHSLALSS